MSKVIRVDDSTYEQLSKKGTLRDSFDSVIQQLLKDQKTEMLSKWIMFSAETQPNPDRPQSKQIIRHCMSK